ncbi:unnamed protein product, partial [Prorocentrum cordatum]
EPQTNRPPSEELEEGDEGNEEEMEGERRWSKRILALTNGPRSANGPPFGSVWLRRRITTSDAAAATGGAQGCATSRDDHRLWVPTPSPNFSGTNKTAVGQGGGEKEGKSAREREAVLSGEPAAREEGEGEGRAATSRGTPRLMKPRLPCERSPVRSLRPGTASRLPGAEHGKHAPGISTATSEAVQQAHPRVRKRSGTGHGCSRNAQDRSVNPNYRPGRACPPTDECLTISEYASCRKTRPTKEYPGRTGQTTASEPIKNSKTAPGKKTALSGRRRRRRRPTRSPK